MGLLRGIWNAITALRNIVINLLFLVILVGVIVALTSQEAITVPESGALVINPSGIIVDQKQPIDPFAEVFGGEDEEPETLLADLIEAIQAAETDSRIKALVLRLDSLVGAPLSSLQELGLAIEQFKSTNKPVYAFGRGYSQGQYYLASFADEITIDSHTFGIFNGVFMPGFASFPLYFAEALEKLKVNVHTFRVGTYKSAVEPYVRNDMSDAVKEESKVWLGDLWSNYAADIQRNRGITAEAFADYTSRYDELLAGTNGDGTKLAISQGLIDGTSSLDEFSKSVASEVGKDDEGDYARIGFREYLKTVRPPIPMPTPGTDQIAVITAQGTILDGEQPTGTVGGETMSRLVERARENPAVKAVVIRIDSPGGSASASERIRSQLAMTQRAGKPVVVSMSGVAASGGYWIAATANKIFAQPSTITGSIGVFSIVPTLENSLAELGINSDGVGTTPLAGSLNPTRELNPRIENMLQISVESTYRKFLGIVSEGRDMTVDEVDTIAQGRVWSGSQAVDNGLVDAIGTLEDAVESAALLADVSDYEVLHIKKELSPREQFINQMLGSSKTFIRAVLGDSVYLVPGLERMTTEMRMLLQMRRTGDLYLHCATCRVID